MAVRESGRMAVHGRSLIQRPRNRGALPEREPCQLAHVEKNLQIQAIRRRSLQASTPSAGKFGTSCREIFSCLTKPL